MSENTQGKKFSLHDLDEIRNLFHSLGYAVVNDFEIPDDELGFDITDNEVLQNAKYHPPDMTFDDLTEMGELNLSEGSFFDSHLGIMAFMRTCTSAIASVISAIVLVKVW